jgi:hypothetical protein
VVSDPGIGSRADFSFGHPCGRVTTRLRERFNQLAAPAYGLIDRANQLLRLRRQRQRPGSTGGGRRPVRMEYTQLDCRSR